MSLTKKKRKPVDKVGRSPAAKRSGSGSDSDDGWADGKNEAKKTDPEAALQRKKKVIKMIIIELASTNH